MIQDANTIVATFTDGMPVTETAVLPTLWLFDECNSSFETRCVNPEGGTYKNGVVVTPETTTTGITNALTATEGTSNAVSCSFGGGCLRSINAPGLTNSILSGHAEVTVCGLPCEINTDHSTFDEVQCAVPEIQTLASIDTFTVVKAGPILGEIMTSPTSIGNLPFDLENLPGIESSGTNCYIGTKFEGDDDNYYVGYLSELRFFMDWFPDITLYMGNLVLEGSDDGVSYSVIYRFD